MAFVIGNVKDSNIDKLEKALSLSIKPIDAKIYGLTINRWTNTYNRLYNAKNKRFNSMVYDASTLRNTYVDDLGNIAGSPFDIKYCMVEIEPNAKGEHDVVATEDDADWLDWVKTNTMGKLDYNYDEHQAQGSSYLDDASSGTDYNWMVRYPLFYYKRPDRNTFLVSSDPVEGFTPSPMHYRGGKLYKYCYVSKFYAADTARPRSINQKSMDNFPLKSTNVKNWLYSKKYYALDFASYNMIRLLGFIKYGSFQLSDFLRPSILSNFTTKWDSIVNNQIFRTSKFKTNYGSTILPHIKDFVLYETNSGRNSSVNSFMGLSEYGLRTLGATNDNATYEFIDGLVGHKNALYVNNDLEDLHIDYIDLTNQNWQQVLGVNSSTLGTNFSKDILYNDGFPWIILPENTSNTYSSYWSWNTANLVPAATASNINYFAVRPTYHNNNVDQANLIAYNFAASDIAGFYRFQFVSDEITS